MPSTTATQIRIIGLFLASVGALLLLTACRASGGAADDRTSNDVDLRDDAPVTGPAHDGDGPSSPGDPADTNGLAATDGLPGTDGLADPGSVADTDGLAATDGLIDTHGLPETDGIADTDGALDTNGIADSNGLPDTDGVSDPDPGPDGPLCTEIGCSDGYSLTIRPRNVAFPIGRYDLHVTPQGEPTRSCYFTVSDDCAATHCVKSADCSATYMVGYQEHSIPDRVVIDYPVIELQVEVTVLRDGIIVGQAVFHPIYEAIQPNGPDCPPTCLQAGDELIVD